VAQVLDYALSLQESDRDDLPDLPISPNAPLEEDLAECLSSGRFLLIIAGDSLDPRALRLSQSMLARHLTSEWDLAMVDLNVYRRRHDEDELIVVPELLGTLQTELRQVVRVVVEGESVRARVVVDKVVRDESRAMPSTSPVSIDDFLLQVQRQVPVQLEMARRIIDQMQKIATRSGDIITLSLRGTSASLYHASPSGPRRFLSLRTDGRLRLVLAYLRTAGLEEVIDKLVEAAPPAFSINRNDRAGGIRYLSTNEDSIFGFLARVEKTLTTGSIGS
jgi:hypothetical protein